MGAPGAGAHLQRHPSGGGPRGRCSFATPSERWGPRGRCSFATPSERQGPGGQCSFATPSERWGPQGQVLICTAIRAVGAPRAGAHLQRHPSGGGQGRRSFAAPRERWHRMRTSALAPRTSSLLTAPAKPQKIRSRATLPRHDGGPQAALHCIGEQPADYLTKTLGRQMF